MAAPGLDKTPRGHGDAEAGTENADELVFVLHPDLVGTLRGKAVRAADLPAAIASGIRWTPANITLTPLNVIAERNPFGAMGDVRLHPDPATEVRVPFADDPPLRYLISDAIDRSGGPWSACVRSLLKRTLAEFADQTGLRVLASFEHEFQLMPPLPAQRPPFSIAAARAVEPFPSSLIEALTIAGLEPEMLITEYGPDQYEVTCAPAEGVAAADRALSLRTVVHEVARRCDREATFSPITDPSGVGNGVHIHLSFLDDAGQPATHDDTRPAGISEIAGRFVSGVLAHADALVAFTAPSPISEMRLGPHRWSASYAFLGRLNREALVRIPGQPRAGTGSAAELDLEFRAVDAAAAPHLALAAVIRAGLAGIREGLSEAVAMDEDVVRLDTGELTRRGISPLPERLEDALEAVGDDGAFAGWLPEELWDAYLEVKRTELSAARGQEVDDVLARYRDFY